MKNLQAWWASLGLKEQKLVAVTSIVIVIAAFYWGIWSPINTSLDEQQAELNKQQQLLSWMKEKGPIIIASKGSGSISGENQSLTQIINATALKKQIKLSRVQPKDEQIQVWIDDIKFETLMTWLEELDKRYGITVDNADLVRGEQVGFAKVRKLQLERK